MKNLAHRDIAACTDCDWLGNRPDAIDGDEDDACPDCGAGVEWMMVAPQQPRGAVGRYRAVNGPEGPRVVCDTDEPGTYVALCGRQQDAEEIASALNAAEGAVSLGQAAARVARVMIDKYGAAVSEETHDQALQLARAALDTPPTRGAVSPAGSDENQAPAETTRDLRTHVGGGLHVKPLGYIPPASREERQDGV